MNTQKLYENVLDSIQARVEEAKTARGHQRALDPYDLRGGITKKIDDAGKRRTARLARQAILKKRLKDHQDSFTPPHTDQVDARRSKEWGTDLFARTVRRFMGGPKGLYVGRSTK